MVQIFGTPMTALPFQGGDPVIFSSRVSLAENQKIFFYIDAEDTKNLSSLVSKKVNLLSIDEEKVGNFRRPTPEEVNFFVEKMLDHFLSLERTDGKAFVFVPEEAAA